MIGSKGDALAGSTERSAMRGAQILYLFLNTSLVWHNWQGMKLPFTSWFYPAECRYPLNPVITIVFPPSTFLFQYFQEFHQRIVHQTIRNTLTIWLVSSAFNTARNIKINNNISCCIESTWNQSKLSRMLFSGYSERFGGQYVDETLGSIEKEMWKEEIQ